MFEVSYPKLDEADRLDVLLVEGSMGRAHALAWKLSQSQRIGRLCVAPGNGGTWQVGENVPIEATDILNIAAFAREELIDLVVVCPDKALELGTVDLLRELDIPTFGPTQRAAEIESSKSFAKRLMDEYGIPTASFEIFRDPDAAHRYVESVAHPVFVKAAKLAFGKGARPGPTKDIAHSEIEALMVEKIFGEAGEEIVIEEWLDGEEISLHAVVDGKDRLLFPSSQDHKQRDDHDLGPMTGGLGTIAPVPWFDMDQTEALAIKVIDPVLQALIDKDRRFQGTLYPGIKGLKTLEYNARFGDPEAQVYMRLMKSDLLELMVATVNRRLDSFELEWHDGFAICVVMASGGYPDEYEIGKLITGLDDARKMRGIEIFHAGTRLEDGECYSNGGRVLGVTAVGKTVEETYDHAYAAVEAIHFDKEHHRGDIGLRPAPYV